MPPPTWGMAKSLIAPSPRTRTLSMARARLTSSITTAPRAWTSRPRPLPLRRARSSSTSSPTRSSPSVNITTTWRIRIGKTRSTSTAPSSFSTAAMQRLLPPSIAPLAHLGTGRRLKRYRLRWLRTSRRGRSIPTATSTKPVPPSPSPTAGWSPPRSPRLATIMPSSRSRRPLVLKRLNCPTAGRASPTRISGTSRWKTSPSKAPASSAMCRWNWIRSPSPTMRMARWPAASTLPIPPSSSCSLARMAANWKPSPPSPPAWTCRRARDTCPGAPSPSPSAWMACIKSMGISARWKSSTRSTIMKVNSSTANTAPPSSSARSSGRATPRPSVPRATPSRLPQTTRITTG